MSNNKVRVTVSYEVEFDIDEVRVYTEWGHTAAKERFLAKCRDTGPDGVRILDFTNQMFHSLAPQEVKQAILWHLTAEIEACDEKPLDDGTVYCNDCECIIENYNYDDEAENVYPQCNGCLELELGEEAAIADKKHKEADKLD